MIPTPENAVSHPPRANVLVEKIPKLVIFILSLIILIMVVLIKQQNECDVIKSAIENGSSNYSNHKQTNITVNISEKLKKIQVGGTPKLAIKQLSCPKSDLLVILEEICADLVIRKELCTPQDFYNESKHKIPRRNMKNRPQKEPKVPAIINYAVGGLLLSSVGAALIELYKAKKQSPNKTGKNPLSRKCSLADLTVLKHHRKELIRRESILEVPEDSSHTKQLDSIFGPLHRRCSSPAGPNPSALRNYETIIDKTAPTNPVVQTNVSNGTSVAETRKQSLVVDSRRTSCDSRAAPADGRRISLDDSPERRYHRLVHRH